MCRSVVRRRSHWVRTLGTVWRGRRGPRSVEEEEEEEEEEEALCGVGMEEEAVVGMV